MRTSSVMSISFSNHAISTYAPIGAWLVVTTLIGKTKKMMYIDTPPGQVVDVSMCYDVVTSTKSPCLLCLLHFVLVPKTIRHTCYVDKKFTLQNTTCRDSQGHCITIATNIILAQIISSPSTSLLLYCPKLKILSQMYMYASYSARVFIDTSHHAYFTLVDKCQRSSMRVIDS